MSIENEKYVFSYDKDDYSFNGTIIARPDPLVDGSFLIPAYSTEIEPPMIEDFQIPVWNEKENKWELVDDYRGMQMYHKKTGMPELITTIGEIPDEYTIIPLPEGAFKWDEKEENWVPDIEKMHQHQSDVAKMEYHKRLDSTIIIKEKAMKNDSKVRERISLILSTYTKSKAPKFTFLTTYGEPVELDYTDIQNFSKEILKDMEKITLEFSEKLSGIQQQFEELKKETK